MQFSVLALFSYSHNPNYRDSPHPNFTVASSSYLMVGLASLSLTGLITIALILPQEYKHLSLSSVGQLLEILMNPSNTFNFSIFLVEY